MCSAVPEGKGISKDMKGYYAQRAAEYEMIYGKPQRRSDLERLRNILSDIFAGENVLEVACGTCYWTQFIARTALAILGIDCCAEVIEIAQQKDYGGCDVRFCECDAYSLSNVTGEFTAGFCGFWWSHIPRKRLCEFKEVFHSRLTDGSLVVLLDNRFVQGESTVISRRDEDGNTYQMRKLSDGTEYEVMKNFPSEAELRKSLEGCSKDVEYTNLDYYWLAKYIVCK